MNERSIQFNELMKSQQFLDALGECQNDNDVVALFAENGVEITIEEVEALTKHSIEAATKQDDELAEEELENVAGGFVISLTTAALLVLSSAELGFFVKYGIRTAKDDPTTKKMIENIKKKFKKIGIKL